MVPSFLHLEPVFNIWFCNSTYKNGSSFRHMVLIFTNWYRNSKCGSSFLSIKRIHKGSRAYRNWQKGSGLIFFWCTFSFMVSPPAFFSIFKIKNRRKESGKEADKKHLRKQVPQFPYHQFSKIGFPNSSFNISASQIFNRPDPPDQFFKIANHKNQFQKFCGLDFSPPIFLLCF